MNSIFRWGLLRKIGVRFFRMVVVRAVFTQR